MSSISETLRATLLSLKQIGDRMKNLILSVTDFRSTLMGDTGTTRIRPLVTAKIVSGGEEYPGVIGGEEGNIVIYYGLSYEYDPFLAITAQEGLLEAHVGQINSFPLGISTGVDYFYPGVPWKVCTEAPADITSDPNTWQVAVINVGDVWRCKEEHKYYDNNDVYVGSIYVYEKIGESEITLGDIRNDIANIELDTTGIAKQGSNTNASLSTIQTAIIDGNDTAISTAKEIRSEVGTGSDTSSENGTLFAVVKWAKDKIKDIYNAITDSTNGLSAIKQAILDNAGISTMTIPDSTAAQELAPNVLYVFSTRTSALTLTLGTPITGIANEYHFFLVAGSTAPAVAFPAGITWNGGVAPTIAANKTYEVSILNNIAAFIEV